jgi:hypothetical protein|nr:MAG TPA: hyaluronase tail fiber protein [Caudoviricetes sp.]
MADIFNTVKIGELPKDEVLDGSEIVPLVDGSQTKKATIAQIVDKVGLTPDLKNKINAATTLDAATGVATGLTNQLREDLTRLLNRKADSSALNDYATKVELNATNNVVNGKADTAAVKKLEQAIEGVKTTANANTESLKSKASTTELTTLSNTVQGKASATELNALTARVGANETELGKKASTDDLSTLSQKVNALSTTVDTKATTASVTSLGDQITALSKRVDGKADKGDSQGQGPTLDSETMAKINSIDSKATKQEVQELSNKVDTKAANDDLTELKRTVVGYNETFKTINTQIEGKAEASELTKVQNTVKTIDDAIKTKADKDEVKALQTSILSKVDSSEIDRLETDIQKKASVENLVLTDSKVDGHETEIQKLKTTAEGYASKDSVETLKTSLGDKASAASVTELGGKVDGLEERVRRLGQQSGDATEIAKSIQRLEASDLVLSNKIDDSIAEINKRATTEDLTALSNKVTANETALAGKASKETTDDLSGKVQSLQTAVAGKAESTALQTVAGKVSSLEEELPKKAGASEVSSLKTKVEGLETSFGSKADVSTVTPLVKKVSDLETAIGSKAAAGDVSDLTSKVGRIESELRTKVNAEIGKGLSSNDFTDGYKARIDESASKSYVETRLGGNLKADGTVAMTADFNAGTKRIINVADSHESSHAVNNKVLKEYLDVYMSYSDETKTKWDAEDKPIEHVAAPTEDHHAANRAHVKTAIQDVLYPTANGFILGGLPSSPRKLISLAAPDRDDGAATKGYVDTAIRGINITFDGDMKHGRIRHVAAPTDAYDAANRDYVDTKVREASVTNPVTYSTTTGAAAEDKLYYNNTSALTLNRITLNTDFRGGITANYNNNTPYLSRNAKLILTRGLMDRVFKVNNVDAYTSTPQGYDNVQCIIPQAPIRSAHTITAGRMQHTARYATDGDVPNFGYMNMAVYPTTGATDLNSYTNTGNKILNWTGKGSWTFETEASVTGDSHRNNTLSQFISTVENPAFPGSNDLFVTRKVFQKLVEWAFKAFGGEYREGSLQRGPEAAGAAFGAAGNQTPSGTFRCIKLPTWLGGFYIYAAYVGNARINGGLMDFTINNILGKNAKWNAAVGSVFAGESMVVLTVHPSNNIVRFKLEQSNQSPKVTSVWFIGAGQC